MTKPLLEGKVAIITGSSSGVGAAAARIFADEGASVVVIYNESEEGATEVVDQIKKTGAKAIKVKANVSNAEEVHKLHQRTLDEFGKVDVLVNNAGSHARLKSYRDVTEEMWNKMLDINLKGAWYCCRESSEIMLKQQSGCIVNVSSMYNVTGAAHNVNLAYGAAKAGVIAITKGYAQLLAPHVRVNCVGMGVAKTRMSASMSDEYRKELTEQTPLRRFGEASEVANGILFLASPLASYVTGQTLLVDGGRFIF